MKKVIYVDHAATTPIHDEVLQAMVDVMQHTFGNPSSVHDFGRKAKAVLNQSRKTIAAHIGARPQQLIFTSGGTEADNLAVMGTALARVELGRHIVTTQMEHHAVLHACQTLEKHGFEVTYLPVDSAGQVSVEAVRAALREDTILISVMMVNNETGVRQPIEEIGHMLQRTREEDGVEQREGQHALFHTDAVQALGLIPIDMAALPVDLLTLSAHKINGPKGIGALVVRNSQTLSPLSYGGKQERERRAGTENLAGIVGFATAVELATQYRQVKHSHCALLGNVLLAALNEHDLEWKQNGSDVVPHILNVYFPQMKAEAVLTHLDLEGIAASSGSACTAGSLEPSHVIEAMADRQRATHSVRFSFGLSNTQEEMHFIAQQLNDIDQRIQQTSKQQQ